MKVRERMGKDREIHCEEQGEPPPLPAPTSFTLQVQHVKSHVCMYKYNGRRDPMRLVCLESNTLNSTLGFSSYCCKAMAMDYNGGCKVHRFRQILKLKEILQIWQYVAPGPKSNSLCYRRIHEGISPTTNRRLRSSDIYCDSDDDGCPNSEPLLDVPKGYLAVYVGPELRRFIIPTDYLSHPVFKVLLEKIEEEFGFNHSGGLTIPCEIETFNYLLKCMENHQQDQPEIKMIGTSLTIEE
ncbi:hypothetical protein F0562_009787 [Nyssa sinensis]|uniref:Uncharacterized protein n=1 Tax=Nyssa sinensis TaxID=561372 RepID=A0A5J4ZZN4_9ASTE|nr:hypothetical protein F0562_009787 [Nyssa sinensis]